MELRHLSRFVSVLDQQNHITEVGSAGQITMFESIGGAVRCPMLSFMAKPLEVCTPATCCMLNTCRMQAVLPVDNLI